MKLRILHNFVLCICISFNVYAQKTVYFYPGEFGNLFDLSAEENSDNIRLPLYEAKVALEKLGYNVVQTRSLSNLPNMEKLICFDVPRNLMHIIKQYPREKKILFLWEPPTTKAWNYNKQYHQQFARVYTLLDDLVDNVTYYKFYEPQPALELIEKSIPFETKKLCCMLTNNTQRNHPLSLTHHRKNIVDFFTTLQTDELDVYGHGWNKAQQPCYKGFASSRFDCFKNYKFVFCYENMHSINGYITGHKLFFPLIAGSVPIYWGPPNITDYIPETCFIDASKFNTYQELYDYIKTIDSKEYNRYLKSIKKYLTSDQSLQFSSAHFVHIILDAVQPGYNSDTALTPNQKVIVNQILD